MDQKQTTQKKELTIKFPLLFVAFELGHSTWRMACSDGRKVRQVTVTARDLEQVQGALIRAQAHFGMAEASAVVSCYEAGRDGSGCTGICRVEGSITWWWIRPVWKWTGACGGPKLTGLMPASWCAC